MLNSDDCVILDFPSSQRIRVLVADDEAPSRNRLVDLLRADSGIDAIFLAENGRSAISIINDEQPDIALLEVRLPEVDGFGVIEAIGIDKMPITIFVTGCAGSPIKAWEIGAVDYILKPFGDERFFSAMQRAKARLLNRCKYNSVTNSRF